jgi:hypothetical protein
MNSYLISHCFQLSLRSFQWAARSSQQTATLNSLTRSHKKSRGHWHHGWIRNVNSTEAVGDSTYINPFYFFFSPIHCPFVPWYLAFTTVWGDGRKWSPLHSLTYDIRRDGWSQFPISSGVCRRAIFVHVRDEKIPETPQKTTAIFHRPVW